MKESRIIGLTGQTGAGKSTVCALWGKHPGVDILDADKVARDVVDGQVHCLADLALAFSIEILNADGTLNRAKLAELVFHDRQKLKKLNSVIFPYIVEELQNRINRCLSKHPRLIVLDAPTLFESKADALCHVVVSVVAPEKLRMERILLRDSLTQEQARARISAQHVEEFYTGRSQFVIENKGDGEELRQRAEDVLESLLSAQAPLEPSQHGK